MHATVVISSRDALFSISSPDSFPDQALYCGWRHAVGQEMNFSAAVRGMRYAFAVLSALCLSPQINLRKNDPSIIDVSKRLLFALS
jgi:hypothetical protein